MRLVVLALALLFAATSAQAQTVPDLKGTWTGKARNLVYGANHHHPGASADASTPRIREIEITYVITGQDGPLIWGHVVSNVAQAPEPMAWSIASDGKTIIGADTDSYYHMTLASADRLEVCYAHNGLSPSKSIVVGCAPLSRKK